MVRIRKSKEKNRRYTNPDILYDITKSKLYYFTSSIREGRKFFRSEVKGYTLEEVFADLEKFNQDVEYRNA